jgi:hypothetical protein
MGDDQQGEEIRQKIDNFEVELREALRSLEED